MNLQFYDYIKGSVSHFVQHLASSGKYSDRDTLVKRVRSLMAHADAREGSEGERCEWRGVASSLALYVGTRSIQSLTADPHSSTASSRLK